MPHNDYPQTPESIQRAQIAQVVERAIFRMETGYAVDAQGRIQHDGRRRVFSARGHAGFADAIAVPQPATR